MPNAVSAPRRTSGPPPAPDFLVASTKIATPEKVPVPDLVIESKKFIVPRMFNGNLPGWDRKTSEVPRPVNEADLSELASWSVPLLLDVFPLLTAQNLVRFCLQQMTNPRFRMIRMENAWGAAEANSSFYDPVIRVNGRWVVSRKPSPDTYKIYAGFRDWAIAIGAKSFRFSSATGVDIEPFAKRLGYDRTLTLYEKDIPPNG